MLAEHSKGSDTSTCFLMDPSDLVNSKKLFYLFIHSIFMIILLPRDNIAKVYHLGLAFILIT